MTNIVAPNEAAKIIQKAGEEFAVIANPDYVFAPFDLAPLAPKRTETRDGLRAAVMDMDGTTTTTEELCLHSLEYMVRAMSGRRESDDWRGLSEEDYPNVIGNSTTKHVEYLVERYGDSFRREASLAAFAYAALWTFAFGKDETRREETVANLKYASGGRAPDAAWFAEDLSERLVDWERAEETARRFAEEYLADAPALDARTATRFGVDVYYRRYHEILGKIADGDAREVSAKLFGDSDKQLVEPMPGVGITLALVKGLLGADAERLAERVTENYREKKGEPPRKTVEEIRETLRRLGERFERAPAKIALVTSSILYEAEIVTDVVFRELRAQAEGWNLPDERRRRVLDFFADRRAAYDAFVTASDSSEIRLKPHRDLYALALHRVGVGKEDFDRVLGFEDSESGALAIRAAGVGLCVAVPFAQTGGHRFDAAAWTLEGGLPEAIVDRELFAPTPSGDLSAAT
jgi:beta-phosphoglucomutase-like phosphatase (HAD superfamily)